MPTWQKPLSLSLGCCVGGQTLLSVALLLFTVTIIFISINFTPSPLGSFVWLLPGPGDIWVQAPGPGPFSLLTLLASRIRAAGWLVEAHSACEQWTDDSDQVSPLSKSTLVFPLWSNYHRGKAMGRKMSLFQHQKSSFLSSSVTHNEKSWLCYSSRLCWHLEHICVWMCVSPFLFRLLQGNCVTSLPDFGSHR